MGAAEDPEINELREYLPLLRALKRLLAAERQRSPVDGASAPGVRRPPLTAEDHAEVEASVQRYLKRQELKR